MKRPTLYAAAGAAVLLLIAVLAVTLAPRGDRAGGNGAAPAAPASEDSPFQLTVEPKPDAARLASEGPEEAKARIELAQVQRRFQNAVRSRDAKAVVALMTPDFVQKSAKGPVINRAQAEKEMTASWPYVVSIDDWALEITSLTVKGNTAVGMVRERMVATIKDEQGKARQETINGRSRNTWVRTASGWKYQRMEEVEKSDTLPGVEYMSSDEWRRSTRERRTAERTQAKRGEDRAAAVSGDRAISKAEARKMLEQMYAKFRADVRRKDSKAALSQFTDDYTVEYPAYNEGRGAVERTLISDLKATDSIPDWSQTVRGVSVDGNTVTATMDERKTTVYRGKDGSKRTARIEATMKDTWIKTRSGWKNRRTEIVRLRAYLDGKLVKELG